MSLLNQLSVGLRGDCSSVRLPGVQALIATQQNPLLAADRPGCNRRQPAGKIGLIEGARRDADPLEAAQHRTKLLFGLDATEDKMRMLVAGWQKRACHFNARVTGLHSLLGRGEIAPHESVDISCLGLRSDLRESSFVHRQILRVGG